MARRPKPASRLTPSLALAPAILEQADKAALAAAWEMLATIAPQGIPGARDAVDPADPGLRALYWDTDPDIVGAVLADALAAAWAAAATSGPFIGSVAAVGAHKQRMSDVSRVLPENDQDWLAPFLYGLTTLRKSVDTGTRVGGEYMRDTTLPIELSIQRTGVAARPVGEPLQWQLVQASIVKSDIRPARWAYQSAPTPVAEVPAAPHMDVNHDQQRDSMRGLAVLLGREIGVLFSNIRLNPRNDDGVVQLGIQLPWLKQVLVAVFGRSEGPREIESVADNTSAGVKERMQLVLGRILGIARETVGYVRTLSSASAATDVHSLVHAINGARLFAGIGLCIDRLVIILEGSAPDPAGAGPVSAQLTMEGLRDGRAVDAMDDAYDSVLSYFVYGLVSMLWTGLAVDDAVDAEVLEANLFGAAETALECAVATGPVAETDDEEEEGVDAMDADDDDVTEVDIEEQLSAAEERGRMAATEVAAARIAALERDLQECRDRLAGEGVVTAAHAAAIAQITALERELQACRSELTGLRRAPPAAAAPRIPGAAPAVDDDAIVIDTGEAGTGPRNMSMRQRLTAVQQQLRSCEEQIHTLEATIARITTHIDDLRVFMGEDLSRALSRDFPRAFAARVHADTDTTDLQGLYPELWGGNPWPPDPYAEIPPEDPIRIIHNTRTSLTKTLYSAIVACRERAEGTIMDTGEDDWGQLSVEIPSAVRERTGLYRAPPDTPSTPGTDIMVPDEEFGETGVPEVRIDANATTAILDHMRDVANAFREGGSMPGKKRSPFSVGNVVADVVEDNVRTMVAMLAYIRMFVARLNAAYEDQARAGAEAERAAAEVDQSRQAIQSERAAREQAERETAVARAEAEATSSALVAQARDEATSPLIERIAGLTREVGEGSARERDLEAELGRARDAVERERAARARAEAEAEATRAEVEVATRAMIVDTESAEEVATPLRAEIAALEAERGAGAARERELEADLGRARESTARLQAEMEAIRTDERERARLAIEGVRAEAAAERAATTEVAAARAASDLLLERIVALEEEHRTRAERERALEADLGTANEATRRLQAEVEGARAAVATAQEAARLARAAMNEAVNAATRDRQLDESSQEALDKYRAERERLEDANAALREAQARLREDLERAEDEVTTRDAKIEAQLSSHVELLGRLEETTRKLEVAENSVLLLRDRPVAHQPTLSEEEQRARLSAEIGRQKDNIRALEKRVDRCKATIKQRSEAHKKELDELNERFKTTSVTAYGELETAKNTVGTLRARARRAESERDKLAEQLAKVNRELALAIAAAQDATGTASITAANRAETAAKDIAQLTAQLQAAERRIAEFDAEREAANTGFQQAAADLARARELEARYTEAMRDLAALRAERDNIQDELESARADIEREQALNEEMVSVNEDMRARLDACTENIAAAASEIDQLRAELIAARTGDSGSQIAALQATARKLRKELVAKSGELRASKQRFRLAAREQPDRPSLQLAAREKRRSSRRKKNLDELQRVPYETPRKRPKLEEGTGPTPPDDTLTPVPLEVTSEEAERALGGTSDETDLPALDIKDEPAEGTDDDEEEEEEDGLMRAAGDEEDLTQSTPQETGRVVQATHESGTEAVTLADACAAVLAGHGIDMRVLDSLATSDSDIAVPGRTDRVRAPVALVACSLRGRNAPAFADASSLFVTGVRITVVEAQVLAVGYAEGGGPSWATAFMRALVAGWPRRAVVTLLGRTMTSVGVHTKDSLDAEGILRIRTTNSEGLAALSTALGVHSLPPTFMLPTGGGIQLELIGYNAWQAGGLPAAAVRAVQASGSLSRRPASVNNDLWQVHRVMAIDSAVGGPGWTDDAETAAVVQEITSQDSMGLLYYLMGRTHSDAVPLARARDAMPLAPVGVQSIIGLRLARAAARGRIKTGAALAAGLGLASDTVSVRDAAATQFYETGVQNETVRAGLVAMFTQASGSDAPVYPGLSSCVPALVSVGAREAINALDAGDAVSAMLSDTSASALPPSANIGDWAAVIAPHMGRATDDDDDDSASLAQLERLAKLHWVWSQTTPPHAVRKLVRLIGTTGTAASSPGTNPTNTVFRTHIHALLVADVDTVIAALDESRTHTVVILRRFCAGSYTDTDVEASNAVVGALSPALATALLVTLVEGRIDGSGLLAAAYVGVRTNLEIVLSETTSRSTALHDAHKIAKAAVTTMQWAMLVTDAIKTRDNPQLIGLLIRDHVLTSGSIAAYTRGPVRRIYLRAVYRLVTNNKDHTVWTTAMGVHRRKGDRGPAYTALIKGGPLWSPLLTYEDNLPLLTEAEMEAKALDVRRNWGGRQGLVPVRHVFQQGRVVLVSPALQSSLTATLSSLSSVSARLPPNPEPAELVAAFVGCSLGILPWARRNGRGPVLPSKIKAVMDIASKELLTSPWEGGMSPLATVLLVLFGVRGDWIHSLLYLLAATGQFAGGPGGVVTTDGKASVVDWGSQHVLPWGMLDPRVCRLTGGAFPGYLGNFSSDAALKPHTQDPSLATLSRLVRVSGSLPPAVAQAAATVMLASNLSRVRTENPSAVASLEASLRSL